MDRIESRPIPFGRDVEFLEFRRYSVEASGIADSTDIHQRISLLHAMCAAVWS